MTSSTSFRLTRAFTGCKILTLTVFFLAISCELSAQYFQFSQYNFTQQRVDPASTGNSRFASVDFVSRSQRTAGDFNINSNFFSAALPLLNPSTGNPWSGIGVSFVEDQSSGIFKRQEASLSYAVHLRVSRYTQLSFGVKGLYQSQQINPGGFTTGAQYVPDRGFDPGLDPKELFQTSRAHYSTFSAGVYWQRVNRKGDVLAHWGLSMFDVNKPAISFLGSPVQVPVSIVFTGAFQAWHDVVNSVSPEILFTSSAGTNVINTGFRFRHEILTMPNQPSDKVDVILKYAVGRSGILGLQFHRQKFSFGVSYDFPVIKTNPSNPGALELGLSFRKPVNAKRKKVVRKPPVNAALRNPRTAAPLGKSVSADTTKMKAIPEVQITRMDTTRKDSAIIRTKVRAGGIQQEPIVVEKITLHFHFDYNSVDLDDETENYLRNLAVQLKGQSSLRVRVNGYTDNVGSAKFNLKLSLRRADAIRNYLIHEGIDGDRIIAVGKGMSEPLNNNETEMDQAKNRRVEIVLVDDRLGRRAIK